MMAIQTVRALIIDDEPQARINLEKCLEIFCKNVRVVSCAGSLREAEEFITSESLDVLFLDIEVGHQTGFDLVPNVPKGIAVVYVTAHEEYALEALKLGATDYILKPLNPSEVRKAVEKVGEFCRQRDALSDLDGERLAKGVQKLALAAKDRIKVTSLEDIVYIGAQDNYSEIHLRSGESIMVARTLKRFDEALKDDGFLRIHQSYLIHMIHLKSYRFVENKVDLLDGISLPISRSNKATLKELLSEFII